MATLLERKNQSVSITGFTRTAKRFFDALTSGKQNRFVVMKNNTPSAVVLPVETFDADKAISHANMVARYSDKED